MEINTSEMKQNVLHILKAGLIPYVTSSPGMGKSAIASEIAKENNLKFIDIRLSQMDVVDLLGFPMIKGDKAAYVPMDLFPIAGDPIPNGYKGWFCIFDELSSAPMALQVAAYKIFLDRKIGQFDLHPKVTVMAAGNLATDKAVVHKMSTALQSRLIHLQLNIDHTHWIDWAFKNDIDTRVISYLNFVPKNLFQFNPNHHDHTFPSPRTWEFVSKLIKGHENLDPLAAIIVGAIGEAVGFEFISHCKITLNLPKIEDILNHPDIEPVSNKASILYAVSSLLVIKGTKENIDNLMVYILRLSIEYQVLILRGLMNKMPDLIINNSVKEWINTTDKELR